MLGTVLSYMTRCVTVGVFASAAVLTSLWVSCMRREPSQATPVPPLLHAAPAARVRQIDLKMPRLRRLAQQLRQQPAAAPQPPRETQVSRALLHAVHQPCAGSSSTRWHRLPSPMELRSLLQGAAAEGSLSLSAPQAPRSTRTRKRPAHFDNDASPHVGGDASPASTATAAATDAHQATTSKQVCLAAGSAVHQPCLGARQWCSLH